MSIVECRIYHNVDCRMSNDFFICGYIIKSHIEAYLTLYICVLDMWHIGRMLVHCECGMGSNLIENRSLVPCIHANFLDTYILILILLMVYWISMGPKHEILLEGPEISF